MNEKRFLKYHYPVLSQNDNLPVNYQYIQIYSRISSNEEGVGKYIEKSKFVCVDDYQLPKHELEISIFKPISKCFKFS